MARKESQPHGGYLMRPDKGETMNPNGRPKKFVTILKESGYTQLEINLTIQLMLQMNLEELKQVLIDMNATILEKTIANAMIKSLKRGSLYSLESLLNRVYGKPKEMIHSVQQGRIEIVYIDGETIL